MVVLNNPTYFDLKTIADSGQCFRIFQIEDNVFDVLSMDKWVRVWRDPQKNIYVFGCEDEEFNLFWKYYFDLNTNYTAYHNTIQQSNDQFLKNAADYGSGFCGSPIGNLLCHLSFLRIIIFLELKSLLKCFVGSLESLLLNMVLLVIHFLIKVI